MILLDTNVLLWVAQEPEQLTDAARSAIRAERGREGLAVAGRSLWEVANLAKRRRIQLRGPVDDLLRSIEAHFSVLPLTAAIALRSTQFSSLFPKDPSDQVIAATALVHNISLITPDSLIRRSGEVNCIW